MDALKKISRIIGNVVEQIEGNIVELPTDLNTVRVDRHYREAVKAQDPLASRSATSPMRYRKGRTKKSVSTSTSDLSEGYTPTSSTSLHTSDYNSDAETMDMDSSNNVLPDLESTRNSGMDTCNQCGKKKLDIHLEPLKNHALAFPEDGIRCLPRESDRIYEELNRKSLVLVRDIPSAEVDRIKRRIARGSGKSVNNPDFNENKSVRTIATGTRKK
ncbi:unnamed protein product [Bursaphelenchus okinawaensis]|uniref:Uncharacterized protein n=1 Tax=Bursaphelenchus okinawaensis TaxID=465554 RepID=A0A811L9K2_9BILA|nr:unnamed protein product [Bursaphelenchus okinawaensis]CAG9119839.1 unnamed protein product [Bursaphelenchus okinawaensis]